MKLVFISGPYAGRLSNTNAARAVAGLVLQASADWVPIVPHLAFPPIEAGLQADGCSHGEHYWYDACIELLRRCDGVLLLNNWIKSKGARVEVSEAAKRNIPVRVLSVRPDLFEVKDELGILADMLENEPAAPTTPKSNKIEGRDEKQ